MKLNVRKHYIVPTECIFVFCMDLLISNNELRVTTNQEIEALMKEENIIRFIKSQRLA